MKIKKLLIIILLLLSTVPILFSHLFTYSKEKTLLHDNIIAKLNDVATLHKKRIHQLLNSKKEAVNLIASRTQLRKLIEQYHQNNSADDLTNVLKVLDDAKHASSNIKGLSVYSLQQGIIASTSLKEKINQHTFNTLDELDHNSINIQVFQSKNEQLTFDFVKKLYINNKHIGYICVEFSNTALINIISDYTGLGRTGEMVLSGRDSEGNTQLLVPTRHNKNSAFTVNSSKNKLDTPINFAINGESTVLQNYVDYRSRPVLAISRYIPELDWGMIIKIDSQEAFEPMAELQGFLIKLVILIIVLSFLVSLYISNKFSKPILALEQVVLGIIQGDTTLRATPTRLIEINRLGGALNKMVSAQLNADHLLHEAIKKLTLINAQVNSESERFKRWKESNFIGILHSDANGNIIEANSTLLNMIGYDEADLDNGAIDWLKLTPEEFIPLDIAAIDEAEEKGFWTPFEKEYFHKDGHRVPILIGGSIFKYDTKEFIVFIIDLSDRNQQLDSLRKYKRIFESSNDLIAYVDDNYQFQMVNYAYSKYHGLAKEQIENHYLSEIIGEEFFQQKVKPSIEHALSGSTIKFTETFDFKEAGKRQLNVTYTPYKNEDNEVVGFIFRGEDISELEAQRQLTQFTKIEQEQVINSMLEGVLTSDHKGVILTFNPEAENIFGYNQDEVIGNNVSLLIPSKYALVHDDYLVGFSRGNNSNMVGNRQGRSVMALHKDQHEFPLRISIAPLPKNKLNKVNFIANFQDLTEAERQKEMINRSLRMESLGTVTGGIAHDFNNILGIITGYCSLLLASATSEKDNRYLSAIEAASTRGAKLTKSLLSFSKNQSTAITVLCINDIILANEGMIKTLLTTDILLEFLLDKSLLLTCIDKNLFEDLLLNMSINAMHAMPNGGILKINTENAILSNDDKFDMPFEAGQYVKITITDNGCGMSEEVLFQIFEPFYTTKGNIGNGLGLSQCYGFVRSSKGIIAVDSIENEGTAFSIYLPVSTKELPEKQPLSSLKTNNESFDAKNYTILIVDDETEILAFNSEVLNNVGFTVFSFDNAEDALALLCKQPIDMVVTDVVMPNMGGVEFIHKAKTLIPTLKHLFVSGYLNEKNTDKAKKIKPLLNKPYTKNELITAIKTQFRESKSSAKPNDLQ